MDRTARFDRIFAAHRRAVHALHFASTHDAEAAADGVQETFLRLWRRLDAIPEPEISGAAERAYVLQAARSVAIDAARRARVRPAASSEADRADSAEHGPGPHEHAAARITADRLDAAIKALPDELREPLVMTVLGGLDSAEVGEALGKPPGTVRYLVHQARVRLEEAMR